MKHLPNQLRVPPGAAAACGQGFAIEDVDPGPAGLLLPQGICSDFPAGATGAVQDDSRVRPSDGSSTVSSKHS